MKNELGRKKDAGPLWTLSPVVLWLLAFLTVPFIIVIIMSFLTRGVYGQVEYTFSGEGYLRLLNSTYIKILVNSLKISLFTTALCLIFGYPFAYYIAKAPKKYRALLLMLIVIPFWTNSLIRTYAWITLLRTEGIINSYLIKLGLISNPIQMLYTDGVVLLGLVYTLFPFMVLPLYASIDNVDKAYLEAASDLGAPPVKTFLKVTLPLTMPGIVAGCLLVYIPTLGLFFIPDLMGGSKIMLISNLIKNQFLTARDWPFGSAISIVVIMITFVFIGVYFKLSGNKRAEVI
ncbi:spermidine/putrescine transport system permease protein PotB [Oxobacter pfennigii]|uniref:Spermidine/putrescine transport system permease protein PotB n=1 Tax=Oxobacter pfennigii TaxID=36849 RepID=A0A0P8Y7A3_9CLOT|nr:spermidine/putrescine transport system permease protein PotB [Oxobacter pfennigii]